VGVKSGALVAEEGRQRGMGDNFGGIAYTLPTLLGPYKSEWERAETAFDGNAKVRQRSESIGENYDEFRRK